MKNYLNKKITFLPLGIFLWQFLVLPLKSFAVTATTCPQVNGKITYCALEPDAFTSFKQTSTTGSQLGDFLSQAFQFGLAIAAALAVIMIVWGGVEIMLSESVFNKDDGRKKIKDAIWGLLLALVAWLILYTINPAILDWSFLATSTPSTSGVAH